MCEAAQPSTPALPAGLYKSFTPSLRFVSPLATSIEDRGVAMSISGNQMALDGLSLIVASGIGFLLWSLTRLYRETHPRHEKGRLFLASRPRR
jgi:hypothetical protein